MKTIQDDSVHNVSKFCKQYTPWGLYIHGDGELAKPKRIAPTHPLELPREHAKTFSVFQQRPCPPPVMMTGATSSRRQSPIGGRRQVDGAQAQSPPRPLEDTYVPHPWSLLKLICHGAQYYQNDMRCTIRRRGQSGCPHILTN